MKAALLYDNAKSLVVEEIKTPFPSENQALIKVKACGLCHTDLHYLDHGVKTFKNYPIVLGHEASGVVELIEPQNNTFKVGDRVMIPSVLGCGDCVQCKSGRSNICLNMQMPGNHIDGGFAEYICVDTEHLVLIPEEVSFEEAALASDALSTAYHSVINRAKIQKNDNIVIFGAGGVGLSVLLMAKFQGANIIVIDKNDSRLALALELGADAVINNSKEDPKNEVTNIFNKRIDCIFEVIGNQHLIEQAISLSVKATKIIIVGYNKDRVLLNTAKTMFYELDILGSLGCPQQDYLVVMNLIKDKVINPSKLVTSKYNLDDINIGFNNLRNSIGVRSMVVF